MAYYIIEHQKRPDGVVNASETSRSSYATALALYHERFSKMVVSTQFVSVALMLTDENLSVMQYDIVETQYTPSAEPAEEA